MRILAILAFMFFLGCSDSAEKQTNTEPNEYTFKYLNDEQELTLVQVKTKTLTANTAVNSDSTEKTRITTSELPIAIAASKGRNNCKQNSYLSSVSGKILFWELPESCTTDFINPKSLGLINIKKILIENLPSPLVTDPKSNIFNVLTLFEVTGYRYVQIKITNLPFDLILDLKTMSIVGFSNQASKETVSVITNLSGNKKSQENFEKLKAKLTELNLLNKSSYTKEDLEQIQKIQKSLKEGTLI